MVTQPGAEGAFPTSGGEETNQRQSPESGQSSTPADAETELPSLGKGSLQQKRADASSELAPTIELPLLDQGLLQPPGTSESSASPKRPPVEQIAESARYRILKENRSWRHGGGVPGRGLGAEPQGGQQVCPHASSAGPFSAGGINHRVAGTSRRSAGVDAGPAGWPAVLCDAVRVRDKV